VDAELCGCALLGGNPYPIPRAIHPKNAIPPAIEQHPQQHAQATDERREITPTEKDQAKHDTPTIDVATAVIRTFAGDNGLTQKLAASQQHTDEPIAESTSDRRIKRTVRIVGLEGVPVIVWRDTIAQKAAHASALGMPRTNVIVMNRPNEDIQGSPPQSSNPTNRTAPMTGPITRKRSVC
jgi:hypothetical protein